MLIYHTTLPQTNQLALFFLSARKAWRGLVTRQLHRTKKATCHRSRARPASARRAPQASSPNEGANAAITIRSTSTQRGLPGRRVGP